MRNPITPMQAAPTNLVWVGRHDTGGDAKTVRITSWSERALLWKEYAGSDATARRLDAAPQVFVGVSWGESRNLKRIPVLWPSDDGEVFEVFVRRDDLRAGPKRNGVSAFGLDMRPRSARKVVVKANQRSFNGGPARCSLLAEFDALPSASGP